MTDRIERDIFIEAPVQRVWTVLTDPVHAPGWFGGATAEADLREGGAIVFRWDAHGTYHARIERLEAPHAFAYRWSLVADEAPRAGNSTLVEFTLAAEGDGTRLRVVETGFASLEPEADRATHLENNRQGWQDGLEGLRAYAAGVGAR
jgi:uncharacterized protein YndB with AHSA1/START domain